MEVNSNLNKAVYLDRDGVLNDLVDRGEGFTIDGERFRWTAPFTRAEVCLKPRVREALELMGQKGYLRILVTNQPDVAGGRIAPDEFERIMQIFRELPLDDLFVCLHRPQDGCACRKPNPGMLLDARDRHEIDLTRSYLVGDQESDIQAGRFVHVKTMLVARARYVVTQADHRVFDVVEAALLLP